jgi:hypothetical protein
LRAAPARITRYFRVRGYRSMSYNFDTHITLTLHVRRYITRIDTRLTLLTSKKSVWSRVAMTMSTSRPATPCNIDSRTGLPTLAGTGTAARRGSSQTDTVMRTHARTSRPCLCRGLQYQSVGYQARDILCLPGSISTTATASNHRLMAALTSRWMAGGWTRFRDVSHHPKWLSSSGI